MLAEYVTDCEATHEAVWLKKILTNRELVSAYIQLLTLIMIIVKQCQVLKNIGVTRGLNIYNGNIIS